MFSDAPGYHTSSEALRRPGDPRPRRGAWAGIALVFILGGCLGVTPSDSLSPGLLDAAPALHTAAPPISVVQGTVSQSPDVLFEMDVYEGDVPLIVPVRAATADGAPLPEGEYCWMLGEQRDCGPVSTHHARSLLIDRPGTYTVALTLTLAGLSTSTGCRPADSRAPAVTARASPRGMLQVSPDSGFASRGAQHGPFDPESKEYTLENVGSEPLEWRARTEQSWLSLSPADGTLPPGGTAVVKLSLNSLARALPPGEYSDTAIFQEAESGREAARRVVHLSVAPSTGALEVSPDGPFAASGTLGGPFEPLSKTYVLRNTGGTTIDWTARNSQPWVTLSASGGALAPGTNTELVVLLNRDVGALPPGDHADLVAFKNTTNGAGDTLRSVTVAVRPVQWASRISQYGITWTFDRAYRVGQFVNGDWWVCPDRPQDPITVVNVDPAPVRIVQTDLNNENPATFWVDGSARNPVWGTQSYDERVGAFAPPATFPLALSGDDSLVSTLSWRKEEPGCPIITQSKPYAPRPSLKRAAVLTCLKQSPQLSCFRPPYVGGPKPLIPAWQPNLTALPRKRAPASAPTTGEAASARLQRLWLDHLPTWANRYLHPSENMRDYGRDFTADFNTASLFLMLDVSDNAKRLVANRCVQIGIDMFHVLEAGGTWGTDGGGHGIGRKWPILLAGLLLNDGAMKEIGAAYPCQHFQEDCQTFYVTQDYLEMHTRLKHTFHLEWKVGSAQWGARHCSQPENDHLSREYRDCCTNTAWCGAALSALMLDARPLWNWEAFFEQTDAWMAEFAKPGSFAYDMWLAYRKEYP